MFKNSGYPTSCRERMFSGACTAESLLGRARAAQLCYESHLLREGNPLSLGSGHGEEDARMSQTPTTPLGKGCRTAAELAPCTGPPPTLLWASGQETAPAPDCQALTFVILPPPKLAKRFSESVRTLEARWMVKRLLADTFSLHLHGKSSSCSSYSTTQMTASPTEVTL